MAIDLRRVQSATHFSKGALERWLKRAEKAKEDSGREAREAQLLCRFCFYRGERVCGQGFTSRDCDNCGVEVRYPNTNTNPLCTDCARKLGLCISCCADRSLADRRKLETKEGDEDEG